MDAKNEVFTPTVLWAQRKDTIYLTITIGDIKDKVLNLTDEQLVFSGRSGVPEHKYAVTIEFHGKVDPAGSRQASTDREIVMIIKKAESGFWPRLLKTSGKPHWLKTDFQRWLDEDDEGAEDDFGGFGGGNFEDMMANMGSFGDAGAGNMDFGGGEDDEHDSDDEDLPDLQDTSAPQPEA